MRRARLSAGFTLVELLSSMLILGIMSILVFPTANMASSIRDLTNNERQRMINTRIASGMLSNARRNTTRGTLPSPYSAGAIHLAPVDTTDLTLRAEIIAAGVDPREMNEDGFAARHVRVFQRVTGLTQSTPIYYQSGPTVTLTYQFGVIYATQCEFANTCNAAMPSVSAQMTSTNYSTWTVTAPDYAPVFVSTLPLQKDMLDLTVRRLDRIRDALISNFTARALLAMPSDTTNWHPTSGTSLAGANPATNQGCRDGWYDLSTTNILDNLGLSASEFGTTAWGGHVEYCRDYDPTGTSGANVVPHYAALRINRDVSSGSNPDSATPANNLLVSL